MKIRSPLTKMGWVVLSIALSAVGVSIYLVLTTFG